MIPIDPKLVAKYNQAGPRYTSYPTAPNWNNDFVADDFRQHLQIARKSNKSVSLYFHIPFCEERCTFCACSVVATKKHEVANSYLEALFKEIEKVSETIGSNTKVEQIHWGGGTPTYLSCEQIEKLYSKIKNSFAIASDAEISIEIDPRVTSDEQLRLLRRVGFNRVSLGVQDFEPEVQKLAGRIQSEEETGHVVDVCRALEYQSINIDLVYGLPKQTSKTFQKTLEKVLKLNPDRVALFNFAYVPWMHAHQKKILETDLPSPFAKLEMFCQTLSFFQSAGYEFIGLDHFAKKDDELSKAKRNGSMYRNFQGYTTKADCDLIGMGVTSISYVSGAFAQNVKKLKSYEEAAAIGFATERGLKLSKDDLSRQWVIRQLFCHQKIMKKDFEKNFNKNFDDYFKPEIENLKKFEEDDLVLLTSNAIQVTSLGRLFLRNIGMIFDAYLQPEMSRFSRTV